MGEIYCRGRSLGIFASCENSSGANWVMKISKFGDIMVAIIALLIMCRLN
jgi:hypothetical protein